MIDWWSLPRDHRYAIYCDPRRDGPACHLGTYGRGRSQEVRVVSTVIGELLAMGYAPTAIRLEYVITPGNRVDVAVPDAGRPIFVECKGDRIDRAAYRQGYRYLEAARSRWPGRDPVVVLAAPNRGQSLVEFAGLAIVTVEPS